MRSQSALSEGAIPLGIWLWLTFLFRRLNESRRDSQRQAQHHRRARRDFDTVNGLRQWVVLRETPFSFISLSLHRRPQFARYVLFFPPFRATGPLLLPLRHLRLPQPCRLVRGPERQ